MKAHSIREQRAGLALFVMRVECATLGGNGPPKRCHNRRLSGARDWASFYFAVFSPLLQQSLHIPLEKR